MKKKIKVKPKKKSKLGKTIGSEEYSVLGALNESKYQTPIDIVAAAKSVMVTNRADAYHKEQYTESPEVKKAVKKLTKKVKRKK